MRRFDGVANVLSISLPHFAQVFARAIQDRDAVTRIRTDLFATDVEFRGSVDRGESGGAGRRRLAPGRGVLILLTSFR